LTGICAGQFMLNLAPPTDFTLFILISVMVSIAGVPILLSAVTAPALEEIERVSMAQLWYRTPMGVTGIILSQWVSSIIFSIGAVYVSKLGMSVYEVANFMGALMAGGMILQWPLGKISDHIDRRWVIGLSSLVAAAIAVLISFETVASAKLYLLAFVFGGFSLSMYSVVVALTNDHLRPHEIVPASGTVILIAGITSVTGPITAVVWQQSLGEQSLFLLLATSLLLLAAISIWRVLTIPALPAEYKTQSTLQAAAIQVGTILHAEEEQPAA